MNVDWRVMHLGNTTTNRYIYSWNYLIALTLTIFNIKKYLHYNLLYNRRLLHDSMRDLCSCWNAMNTMFILQHTTIKASFQKSINMNICGFVSREAQDVIFHELKRIDNIVHMTRVTLGDLTLTHEVDALFKRFSQLEVCGKINLKTKACELIFLDTTLMRPPPTKIKTKGAPKSMKSTKCEPSISGTPSLALKLQQYILKIVDVTLDENYGYKAIAALLGQGKESWSLVHQYLI
ncbi:hypothetical protein HKD37_04G010391 [Glycine soja]